MTAENQFDDAGESAAKHPEVTSDPESTLPAPEYAKKSILDRVEAAAKAGEQRDDGSWHASKVSSSGNPIRLHFWPTPESDGFIASVIETTDYNEREGTGTDIGYRILRIPDGLHIERGVREHIDLRESRQSKLMTHEETLAAAEETLAMVERRRAAVAAESELGLRIFSARDAEELIALLDSSQTPS